jgi:hypothetical protein
VIHAGAWYYYRISVATARRWRVAALRRDRNQGQPVPGVETSEAFDKRLLGIMGFLESYGRIVLIEDE